MCKKSILKVEIMENAPIASGVYKMVFKSPEISREIRPGQFLNIYLRDESRLLPRPISICEIKRDTVTLVYGIVGKGTEEMSLYLPGEQLKISSPNGNGFLLDDFFNFCKYEENQIKDVVLVGGGIGVPPLVELAKYLRKNLDIKITGVIGFKDEPFLVEELKAYCDRVFIATESGSIGYKGNILRLIQEIKLQGQYYFACGPEKMLKHLTEYCMGKDGGIPIQVSMEERMGCGYGACVGCTCQVKASMKDRVTFSHEALGVDVALKKVCKDGPVFMGKEVIWHD